MLDVLEVRNGTFELGDRFLNEDRNRTYFLISLSRFGLAGGTASIFFTLFLRNVVTNIVSLSLAMTIIVIAMLSIILGLIGSYTLRFSLGDELNGLTIQFNEQQQLATIHTRTWVKSTKDEFIEQDVRFNQSIGFQAVLMEEGDIFIEIIVDPNFPGTTIFRTYDLRTLAEFILTFQKILPEMDKWYYKQEDGSDWTIDLKSELNDEIKDARVPITIRGYYGLK